MLDKPADVKTSGSTIAAVFMGLILLVFLALSSPDWGAAPYVEALVIFCLIFICSTENTNRTGAGNNAPAPGSAVNGCVEGALDLCLETGYVPHHDDGGQDDGGWNDAGGECCDCDFY